MWTEIVTVWPAFTRIQRKPYSKAEKLNKTAPFIDVDGDSDCVDSSDEVDKTIT